MRNNWVRDFALGIRLAVGGGRTSWARLALGTVGIGMAVLVLLVAASAGNISHIQDTRRLAAEPVQRPIPGVAPLEVVTAFTTFHGNDVEGRYLHATGPNSPVPPGIPRVPGPDEVYLSQALADLLHSPDGALLRPRFPQRVVGVIAPGGVSQPGTLTYYAGVGSFQNGSSTSEIESVYSFGGSEPPRAVDFTLLTIALIGAVALLVPILIFVAVSSRIAGAQRDRRLAALRLVGAGGRQVRRIAAAESLVSAGFGLVVGAIAFLIARQFASSVELFGWSAYPGDITPSVQLVVLIIVVIPVLAVGSSLFAMRRTIIEPLGVMRAGKPVRRRLWWRLALVVIGVTMLLMQNTHDSASMTFLIGVGGGTAALLIGVPVLLPWLLERTVGTLRGGVPSWQLAVRRLQLDSGTPARVVGGVAVVLAGAIALQTVLFAAANRYDIPRDSGQGSRSTMMVLSNSAVGAQVDAALRTARGVRSVNSYENVETHVGTAKDSGYFELAVAPCSVLENLFHVGTCADGDVFIPDGHDPALVPGARMAVLSTDEYPSHAVGSWTVPAGARTVPSARASADYEGDLLVTPGALAGVTLPPDRDTRSIVGIDPDDPNAYDHVANAIGRFAWQAEAESFQPSLTTDQKSFLTMRNTLLAGSLFTLLLAGVSMLVLALEQVRERRRPISVLAAAGTPTSVLARSLLWQTAFPVAIGVVVAMAVGIGLAALVIRMTSMSLSLDWVTMGIFSAATVVLVLLVTAATLPALRGATRLTALRTE